ncbi:MAG: threonylcarbamoyl-AMP synthase [Tannerellaceae bacterium]|jgi:L-threonylcarbamoyladenylate synthase|nr:threonylcarbamoyl-AMP synthase [Tannerellaceae bacterium]
MTEEVKKACRIMAGGGLIAYPTDTVWGIGCDATDEAAVEKVYNLKRRADRKAMIVLLDTVAKLEIYVENIPNVAWQLIEAFDSPLTIIYEHGRNLASNLTAADGSIGIRVTREAFSNALCKRFRKPVVSTSANVSGEPFPTNYSKISSIILGGVDYVVDYRRDDRLQRAPSGIIRLGDGGLFEMIR